MLGIITAIKVQNNKNNQTKDYKKIEKMFEIFNLLERKEEFGYVKKMETFLKYLKKQAKLKLSLLKITVFLKKMELLNQL